MLNISVAELRKKFIEFFENNGHKYAPSASLIPHNDPTLLFTNAGMVPFKDYFLGFSKPPASRMTSVQRCVRAGGKHNDLDNVGYTARHHTFFEMLGNFSFGDYFKQEAIRMAWSFLTEELQIPAEKLWVTVYQDDDESAAIWLDEVGVSKERFSRCGEKDNFWSMGPVGPCGPCTEIFFDHGAEVAGGPPGSADEDGDRYIEIWNIVFMQYDRAEDGKMTPLPQPCVDTGMGLERIAAVLQGVHNNYDIDLFKNLITAIAEQLGVQDLENKSLRVLADHLRSTCFLIIDGVNPGNEGRSYVLRRIMRRAIRHGYALGGKGEFFSKFVPALVAVMGEAYPELAQQQEQLIAVINKEEKQFAITLHKGMSLLEEIIPTVKDKIPGDIAFKLYDTYGFPVDLTADVAREHGLEVDYAVFEEEMAKQRERSSAAGSFSVQNMAVPEGVVTEFLGYAEDSATAVVKGCVVQNELVTSITADNEAVIILDRTPFYAESGGQVGDTGIIRTKDGKASFLVKDTQKQGEVFLHFGVMQAGTITTGMDVEVSIDSERRNAIRANHSATHLLHAALHNILGDSVLQKGSLVDAERLRFDFSFDRPVSSAELNEIESWVNAAVYANHIVAIDLCNMEEAKQKGALALFGEKYGDEVRVISMGDVSTELCGGTHVARTGDIGSFKITLETSAAAGIRRLEAVTRGKALQLFQQQSDALRTLAELVKCGVPQLQERVAARLDELNVAKRQVVELTNTMAQQQAANAADEVIKIGELSYLGVIFKGMDRNALRQRSDELAQKLGDPAAVLLASLDDSGNVALVTKVSKSAEQYISAVDLIRKVCDPLDGRGGGRSNMAQGGASANESTLQQAFAQALEYLKSTITH